jgi:hypothetical protein
MTTLDRIAAVMGCTPEDDDDLIEAVRLLVAERDEAKADRARLREYIDDCGRLAVGLVERVHNAVETYQCVMRERDAAVAQLDALAEEVRGLPRPEVHSVDCDMGEDCMCGAEPDLGISAGAGVIAYAAVAQRDALARASRRYIAAADAFLADACAGEPEHAAALRALVAALAAAGGGA